MQCSSRARCVAVAALITIGCASAPHSEHAGATQTDGRLSRAPDKRDSEAACASATAVSNASRNAVVHFSRSTELHLGGLDGPIIGAASAGARVQLSDVEGCAARVVLRGYPAAPGANEGTDPLEAVVDVRALSDRSVAATPLDVASPTARIVRGYTVDIAVAGGQRAFTTTECGLLEVFETTPTGSTRVVQRRDGIEIHGRTQASIRRRIGPDACSHVAIRGDARDAPTGYVPVDQSNSSPDPLADRLASLAHVYWMDEKEDGSLACTDWRFAGHWDESHSTFDAALTRRERDGDDDLDIERGASYQRRTSDTDAKLIVYGPAWKVRSRRGHGTKSFGSLCAATYTVVGASGDVLTMLEGHFPAPVVAYDPRTAGAWYLSKDACMRAMESVHGELAFALAAFTRQGC